MDTLTDRMDVQPILLSKIFTIDTMVNVDNDSDEHGDGVVKV